MFRHGSAFKVAIPKAEKMEARMATMMLVIVVIFVVCNSFQNVTYILKNQKVIDKGFYYNYLGPIRNVLVGINSRQA